MTLTKEDPAAIEKVIDKAIKPVEADVTALRKNFSDDLDLVRGDLNLLRDDLNLLGKDVSHDLNVLRDDLNHLRKDVVSIKGGCQTTGCLEPTRSYPK